MATTFASIGMEKLSFEQKNAVIRDLEEDMVSEIALPEGYSTREEWFAELDRRVAEDDAHPENAVPWETVKAELAARFGW